MKFKDFKTAIQNFPLFSTSQISSLTENEQVLRNQLTRWEKMGLVLKLKKGLYILNSSDRKINPSRMFIANQLCSPSYISTEYALEFYNLIPERVIDVTSVTTKKTVVFENIFGTFRFQHIKTNCFSGFKELKDETNLPFFIAEPEKAIVDFLYLNLASFKGIDPEIFALSYRFQNVSGLHAKRLKKFAEEFNSKKLSLVVQEFIKFMDSGE